MEEIREVLAQIETEHGIFTEDKENGLTAEEFYQKWLLGLNQPIVPEPNKIDICLQQLVEAQTLLVDLQMELLMNGL